VSRRTFADSVDEAVEEVGAVGLTVLAGVIALAE
jgi:hypothetical protein